MEMIYPKHDHILCIDSDGCAMDTMTIKHKLFFGPLIVKVFNIDDNHQFLKMWDQMNLYSETRGINRFKGLVEILKKIDYPHIDHLKRWVETTPEYSVESLKQEIAKNPSEDLEKALEWSNRVNAAIAQKSSEFKPFTMALKVIPKIAKKVDIAVVSSANKDAVVSEWTRTGMISSVNIVLGQEDGKKENCLKFLSKYYDSQNIMMVGDAVGDYRAAQQAGVQFYPILTNYENQSWKELNDNVMSEFVNNTYNGQSYYQLFIDNFKKLKDIG